MNLYPAGTDVVVQSRLTPPRLPQHWLIRPRLEQQLGEAVHAPLTIIQASAGYGKTSTLAAFAARSGWPTLWLRLCPADDDPLHLLTHLIHACQHTGFRVGREALALLQTEESTPMLWWAALDLLTNDLQQTSVPDLILILDDLHLLCPEAPGYRLIERLIGQQPPNLHVILATLNRPDYAILPSLRARGDVLELDERHLAFTPDEIADLFETAYAAPQSDNAVQAMTCHTGGWPVGVRLLAQALAGGACELPDGIWHDPGHDGTEQLLDSIPGLRAALFEYFASEVLAPRPEPLRRLLLGLAAFDDLDPSVCAALLGLPDATNMLGALRHQGLFVQPQADGPDRYHPLFLAFLRDQARHELPDWAGLHERAAMFFHTTGNMRRELHHLIAAGRSGEAARLFTHIGADWLAHGHPDDVPAWIRRFPPDVVAQTPELRCLYADALRLMGRLTEAQEQFGQAERLAAAAANPLCRTAALCGSAQVALDQCAPTAALNFLRQARHTSFGTQADLRRHLTILLCEAHLHQGNIAAAERLLRLAERTGIDSDHVFPHLLVRSGRLHEARLLLERHDPHHPEQHAVQSLLYALDGMGAAAYQAAEQSLAEAKHALAPIAEIVAETRMGHACQIGSHPNRQAARRHYTRALERASEVAAHGTRIEACLGLALLDGFALDLTAAETAAREGLVLAHEFGDTWLATRLEVSLAATAILAELEVADQRLNGLLNRVSEDCDPYAYVLIRVWAAIRSRQAGRTDAFITHARDTVALAIRYGYTSLLTGQTLLGPRDRMMLVPLLLAARDCPEIGTDAQSLLLHGFPLIASDDNAHLYHPGVSLRIQALDRLRVWRGAHEIEARRWHRKKALHLLGLLITNRHRWLLRDQICEALWPDEDHEHAETQFKVTLNALVTTLEPDRPPRLPSFFIRRHGGAYRLAPPEGLWLDVDAFEAHLDAAAQIAQGDDAALGVGRAELTAALALYRSDYLIDCLYEEWAATERERLQTRYLEASAMLAQLQLDQGHTSEAVRLCEQILARDPCWEEAYTLMMRAYIRQGNRRRAITTYERCRRVLQEQLGVAPPAPLTQLYEELRVG